MFRTRLISGIVLVALAILLVTKGGVLLYCVTAAISLIGMFELYRVMGIEKKAFCADLILTDAIIDMADEDGITWQEARSKIINSAAYTALYDFENGLWENGPDYFRDYYKKIA